MMKKQMNMRSSRGFIRILMKRLLVLILILSLSIFALEIKNNAYERKEEIAKNDIFHQIYDKNGVKIKIKIDKNNCKNIYFYFDNKTDKNLCCFASVECEDKCILQSSSIEIPKFCENYSVELFGAWRENDIYINGILINIQPFDKSSFKEIHRETFEILK